MTEKLLFYKGSNFTIVTGHFYDVKKPVMNIKIPLNS